MNLRLDKVRIVLLIAGIATVLSGCLSGSSDDASASSSPPIPGNPPPPGSPPPPPPPPTSGNQPPSLSGNPPTSAVVGQTYSFAPNASDGDGDALTFSIENQPQWANFDSTTGMLSGTPTIGSVGTFSDIQISVSDGQDTVAMPRFAVQVSQIALGAATLSWTAPTLNTDGSPLTDLAAYKIYYGTSPNNYTEEVYVDNPGTTTFVIENLAPNTYYFASTSINTTGIESALSNVASMTVN